MCVGGGGGNWVGALGGTGWMGAGGTLDGALDGRSIIRGRSKQVSLK